MSVFKNQDTMIELLENAGKARRKELLDDMRYDTSDKSFPKLINIKDAKSAHDHHFVYEYDHRNLETEIDGANDPCKGLSQLNRQLTQEGDMRVFFDENKVKPIKVIKKRSLECKQGIETYSIKDENGDDRLLQADEILFKGEPTVSSEDIYDQCEKVPFDMVNSQYIPPMDTWDIVLDATEAIQEMNRRCKFGIINNFNKEQQIAEISSMVYSSNVYPEIRDKRYSQTKRETF